MTEREMLVWAAKAADYEASDKLWDEFGFFKMTDDNKPNGWRPWRPLTDDGDALRLAVALMMRIEIFRNVVCVEAFDGEEEVREEVTGDPSATTRLAIVRAAAEIGRSKHE